MARGIGNDNALMFRSACPVASFLDIIGDKWTLLVIRDLFAGVRRYNEFLAGPERITTNILADRLKLLEAEGLISRTPYQQNPLRYEYALTEKGRAIKPVLQAVCDWSQTWLPDRGARVAPRPES